MRQVVVFAVLGALMPVLTVEVEGSGSVDDDRHEAHEQDLGKLIKDSETVVVAEKEPLLKTFNKTNTTSAVIVSRDHAEPAPTLRNHSLVSSKDDEDKETTPTKSAREGNETERTTLREKPATLIAKRDLEDPTLPKDGEKHSSEHKATTVGIQVDGDKQTTLPLPKETEQVSAAQKAHKDDDITDHTAEKKPHKDVDKNPTTTDGSMPSSVKTLSGNEDKPEHILTKPHTEEQDLKTLSKPSDEPAMASKKLPVHDSSEDEPKEKKNLAKTKIDDDEVSHDATLVTDKKPVTHALPVVKEDKKDEKEPTGLQKEQEKLKEGKVVKEKKEDDDEEQHHEGAVEKDDDHEHDHDEKKVTVLKKNDEKHPKKVKNPIVILDGDKETPPLPKKPAPLPPSTKSAEKTENFKISINANANFDDPLPNQHGTDILIAAVGACVFIYGAGFSMNSMGWKFDKIARCNTPQNISLTTPMKVWWCVCLIGWVVFKIAEALISGGLMGCSACSAAVTMLRKGEMPDDSAELISVSTSSPRNMGQASPAAMRSSSRRKTGMSLAKPATNVTKKVYKKPLRSSSSAPTQQYAPASAHAHSAGPSGWGDDDGWDEHDDNKEEFEEDW